jgi:GrpB-like predicted nucleotidyltransferase (UPF0157 family)
MFGHGRAFRRLRTDQTATVALPSPVGFRVRAAQGDQAKRVIPLRTVWAVTRLVWLMDPKVLDPGLISRLTAVGVEDLTDSHEAWHRLHAGEGRRATLVDRYAIEAAARGVAIDDLSEMDRARLSEEVLVAQYSGIEMVGRTRGDPNDVVAYDAGWPRRFSTWRERLVAALGSVAVRIDHIGSTAVPALAAKPVIDILIGVRGPDAEEGYAGAIDGLGVPLRTRQPDRRYFRPTPGGVRVVQIHVCRSGSTWERDHLLFRDYLRNEVGARNAYEA